MKKLFVVFMVLFLLVGCSSTDDKKSDKVDKPIENKEQPKKEDPKEEPKEEIYKTGDTVVYSKGDKEMYSFTVNSAKLTEERNQFSEKEVSQVVVINYSYNNIADPEDVFIFSMHFTVIDEDGNVAETYPAGSNVYPQKAPTGTKSSGEESYGLVHESKKIKLIFKPEPYGNTKVTFNLDLE